MVKAIIVDVDGVLAGSKKDVNYPNPNTEVITALKNIHKKGIPIIICTGNYYFSKLPIIQAAELRNPHITDNGALIINPLDNKVISKHAIEKAIAFELVDSFIKHNVYIEVYTDQMYFLQNNQVQELTEMRTVILQQNPVIVNSIAEIIKNEDIIKVNAFTKNESEEQATKNILETLEHDVHGSWTLNPAISNTKIVNITRNGISKKYGATEAIKSLGISFEDVLGVGDTTGDWSFMSLCNYAAAMGNASDELKDLVKTKGEGNYMIAPHVDDNGILEVFKYFNI